MKSIYRYTEILLLLLLVMGLSGCSDDDDIGRSYSEYEDAVIGEWYPAIEYNDYYQERYTFEFGKDGSYWVMSSAATIDGFDYDIGYGTYSLNGKTLKESFTMNNMLYSGDYEIRSIGKYVMHLFLRSNYLEETDYRIVETVHIKVGESDKAFINDPDFVPENFFSDDKRVVEVDNAGNFLAKRQGTAYILVRSSLGTAVIRVVVEADTYVDDFIAYMDEPISKATNAYGNLFGEEPFEDTDLIRRNYYLIDDKVQQVIFIYNQNGIVERVHMKLRELSDFDKVMDVFYKKYQYEAEQGDLHYFSTTKSARKVSISVGETSGDIECYYEDSNDPFLIIDNVVRGIANMSASEAFSYIGQPITEQDIMNQYKFIPITSSVFDYMAIHFDPNTDEISKITVLTNPDITWNDLDIWYSKHYILTGYDGADDLRYYCFDPRMGIQLEKHENIYYVNYYMSN